ncbi:MAG TPA: flagellar biosynthesis anti-sigma factor FlgM [Vulgatibacter sp.]|nr:flagellar biosynthesis anti-sigma factor FlgM [Vulgatibacter sp.]
MKSVKEIAGIPAVKSSDFPSPAQSKERTAELTLGKGPVEKTPTEFPAGRDRVTIDKSAELQQVVAAAREAATKVHSTKVAEIEAAIRQGLYKPDPQRIAQQILNQAEVSARIQAIFLRLRR